MAHVTWRGAIKLGVLALALTGLAAPGGAGAGNDNRAPDLGSATDIQVGAGNKVAFIAYAEGVQIYRWNGSAWAFVAPEAVLMAGGENGGEVGVHYRGPTWEFASGGTVVGEVVKPYTADPDAIPWLLLRAKSTDGPGVFQHVTFIQRLYTTGGKAPASAGDEIGEEVGVPYTAVYYFYRAEYDE